MASRDLATHCPCRLKTGVPVGSLLDTHSKGVHAMVSHHLTHSKGVHAMVSHHLDPSPCGLAFAILLTLMRDLLTAQTCAVKLLMDPFSICPKLSPAQIGDLQPIGDLVLHASYEGGPRG